VSILAFQVSRSGHFSPDVSSRPGVTATEDMTVLPGVLGCRTLRRTVQVRLRSNPAVPRDCPVAHPSPRSRDVDSRNIWACAAVPGGRPLLVPRSCGPGPGFPPAPDAEVAQTFRQVTEEQTQGMDQVD
jgi:hypothetical protein